ncbi:organic solute transporter subunit alpha-like [Amphiura filiformis]|uniref:organic solute transporter subunit alpha-like n=1 Tax=Amphiura filiformis TaxID=82378 RepID=UPI003B214CA7
MATPTTMPPDNITNSTCDAEDPPADEWLDEIFADSSLTAWLIVIIVCTIVVFIFYVESIIHIGLRVSHKGRRLSIFWILSMCPVYCIVSMIGFILPRGMVLCNVMAALFYAIGLYFFLALILYYYGGDEAAIMKMTDTEIPLLFCCKKPSITLDEKCVFWFKITIGQFTVLRSGLLYLEAILWMDGSLNLSTISWTDASLYIYAITFVSAIVALWGLLMLLYASKKHLYSYYITPKVWIMVFAMLISNLQIVLLGILATTGALPCKKPFHTVSRANYWQSLLLTLEATALFPIVLLYFRTKKGNVVGVLEVKGERPKKRRFYKKGGSSSSLYNTYTVL